MRKRKFIRVREYYNGFKLSEGEQIQYFRIPWLLNAVVYWKPLMPAVSGRSSYRSMATALFNRLLEGRKIVRVIKLGKISVVLDRI